MKVLELRLKGEKRAGKFKRSFEKVIIRTSITVIICNVKLSSAL